MPRLILKNLTKRYSPSHLTPLESINLICEDQEFMVILGPEGCGKSTIIRLIAGLEKPTQGEIYFGDKLVNDVPAKERSVGLVFKNYAFYSSKTVFDILAVPLKINKLPKPEIRLRIMEIAELLKISELLERKIKELSDVQRKWLSIALTLVRKPAVWLLDDIFTPLENTRQSDQELKAQDTMRKEILKLHKKLATTTIYATSNPVEAVTMGDRIAVINYEIAHPHKIQQIADPATIYNKPSTLFVARYIGRPGINILEGHIERKSGVLCFSGAEIAVKIHDRHVRLLEPYVNREILMGIRPEDVTAKAHSEKVSRDNIITAVVEAVEPIGEVTFICLRAGNNSLIARANSEIHVEVNQEVDLRLDMQMAHYFDKHTEQAVI